MEEDWTGIADAALRKRIQNRLAQRKHRRKAQEQGAMQGGTAQSTGSTETWNAANGQLYLRPPYYVPDLDAAQSPTAHADDSPDTAAMEDSIVDSLMTAGLERSSWNLGPSSGFVSDPLTPNNVGGMLSDMGNSATRASQKTDRHVPAGFPQHARTSSSAAMAPQGFSQALAGDAMLRPENSPHQNHNPHYTMDATFSGVIPEPQRMHCSHTGMNAHLAHPETCAECHGEPPRPHRRASRPGERMRSDFPATGLSSPAHGHGSPSRSSTHSSQRSSLLREHGIDINQLLSHADSGRRYSTSSNAPRPPSCVHSPENAVSHSSLPSRGYHHHHRDHPTNFEVVQPNHGNDEEEGGGPRVTKIVVIYMDEQDRT